MYDDKLIAVVHEYINYIGGHQFITQVINIS